MKIVLRFKPMPICVLGLILLGASAASASIVHDLGADWDNVNSASSPWSVSSGANPLPFVQDYIAVAGDQNAYASAAFPALGHVPIWAKMDTAWQAVGGLGLTDLALGDVFVHGSCCSNLPNSGLANVTWTSDVTGTASIAGGVWWASTLNRNSDWRLLVNSTLVSSGNVAFGDVYDRANPFSFAHDFNVGTGDVVTLEVGDFRSFDHWVGVDLSIEVVAAVPEPGIIGLLSIGLAGFGFARRARPSASSVVGI